MTKALNIPIVPAIRFPSFAAIAPLTDEERSSLITRIKRLLKEQDAVLVAHYLRSAS